MEPVSKYKFDDFEADLKAAELRRNGTRLKLQLQPFQVLVALLERPRDVVTRDELRQRLWPEDTFVDFDHGLNTAMAKLRDVLGDSAAKPRYVETIAKRGYRFLGDVTAIHEQPKTAPAIQPIKPLPEPVQAPARPGAHALPGGVQPAGVGRGVLVHAAGGVPGADGPGGGARGRGCTAGQAAPPAGG